MLITDQLGRTIELSDVPKRIVSLVPSQTEFLYDLGLGDQIVGQTLFCVHPVDKFKKATKVGGTKKLNLSKIRALKPDLIIANKEENNKIHVNALENEFPVWISDVKDMASALEMMQSLGNILGKSDAAQQITSEIRSRCTAGKDSNNSKKTVLYMIWQKPWMAAGRKTYINEMLGYAGFTNVINDPDSRYPKLFEKDIADYKADYLFISTEPYPFNEVNVAELQKEFPDTIVKLVDGAMFSWYGSRMVKAFSYFKTL